MYSVVLAVAITAAPANTGWHHRGCGCYHSGYSGYHGHGCYSSYGCYGVYPGYGCHGCAGGAWHNPNPEVTLYGGAGAGYGYHGGCYGAGYASNYYFDPAMGCTGCYGAHGGHSGYGIPVPPIPEPKGERRPVDPFPPLEPEKKKDPKGAEEIPEPKEVKPKGGALRSENQRAIVRVHVPEGGKLYVDGKHINVPAGIRAFQTPALAQGQRFFYDMKVEVEIAGIIRKEEHRVIVERGQEVAVEFPSIRAADTQTARRQK